MQGIFSYSDIAMQEIASYLDIAKHGVLIEVSSCRGMKHVIWYCHFPLHYIRILTYVIGYNPTNAVSVKFNYVLTSFPFNYFAALASQLLTKHQISKHARVLLIYYSSPRSFWLIRNRRKHYSTTRSTGNPSLLQLINLLL